MESEGFRISCHRDQRVVIELPDGDLAPGKPVTEGIAGDRNLPKAVQDMFSECRVRESRGRDDSQIQTSFVDLRVF